MTDTMIIPIKPFFVAENEALKKKVKQLEKEADWLAQKLANMHFDSYMSDVTSQYTANHASPKYWRERAQKAVVEDEQCP